jgi:hypothetical protein
MLSCGIEPPASVFDATSINKMGSLLGTEKSTQLMEGNRWYGLNPEVAESIGHAVNHSVTGSIPPVALHEPMYARPGSDP